MVTLIWEWGTSRIYVTCVIRGNKRWERTGRIWADRGGNYFHSLPNWQFGEEELQDMSQNWTESEALSPISYESTWESSPEFGNKIKKRLSQ